MKTNEPEEKEDFALTAIVWWWCLVPSLPILIPLYAYISNLKYAYVYAHDLRWTATEANLGLLEAIVNILLSIITIKLVHKFLGNKIKRAMKDII